MQNPVPTAKIYTWDGNKLSKLNPTAAITTKIDKAIKRYPKMFVMLESAVEPGCFGTSSFSMADCFVMPILNATNMFDEGKEAIANSPKLNDYFAKMQERVSFQATAK